MDGDAAAEYGEGCSTFKDLVSRFSCVRSMTRIKTGRRYVGDGLSVST